MEVLTKGVVRGNIIIPGSPARLINGSKVEIFLLNIADPICGSLHDERTVEEIVKDIEDSLLSRDLK